MTNKCQVPALKQKLETLQNLICMIKVQNISGITPNIRLQIYDLYRKTFENSELGRIKSVFYLVVP